MNTGQFVKVESGTTKEEYEKVEINVPVPVHIVLLDGGVITKHSLIQYMMFLSFLLESRLSQKRLHES